MQVDALVIILVLILGCAAFLFGVISLIWQILAWVGRGMVSTIRPRPAGKASPAAPMLRSRRVCPRLECRRVEKRREARYCSQCGSPMN